MPNADDLDGFYVEFTVRDLVRLEALCRVIDLVREDRRAGRRRSDAEYLALSDAEGPRQQNAPTG
jgi:hypothetical protein